MRAVHSRAQYLRGSGRSSSHATPPNPGHWTSTPYGERDAHLAARQARPARAAARRAGTHLGACGLRAALRRGGHRVPGLPDLSQLRLGLLADLGARAVGRRAAVLRRLPCADRASAGRRLRRGALATGRGGAANLAGLHGPGLLRPGRGRLPPGPRGVHAVGRCRGGAAGPQPPGLRLPGRARLRRRALPGDGRLGCGAGDRETASRRGRLGPADPRRPPAPRGLDPARRLLAVVSPERQDRR